MRQSFKNENDVKDAVKEVLKEFGWFNWPNAAGPHSIQGLSDRMALYCGAFLAVECKFGRNPLRPAQHRFLREVVSNGGWAVVVSDANIRQFRDSIDEISGNRQGTAFPHGLFQHHFGESDLAYRP